MEETPKTLKVGPRCVLFGNNLMFRFNWQSIGGTTKRLERKRDEAHRRLNRHRRVKGRKERCLELRYLNARDKARYWNP